MECSDEAELKKRQTNTKAIQDEINYLNSDIQQLTDTVMAEILDSKKKEETSDFFGISQAAIFSEGYPQGGDSSRLTES